MNQRESFARSTEIELKLVVGMMAPAVATALNCSTLINGSSLSLWKRPTRGREGTTQMTTFARQKDSIESEKNWMAERFYFNPALLADRKTEQMLRNTLR